MGKCKAKTEVYSRVVGYYRPVQQWNKGKASEFKDRKYFSSDSVKKGLEQQDGEDIRPVEKDN